jgi:nucleoside-triphosphatase
MTGSAAPKIFLTGDPGCGKTTALRRVVERLDGHVPMTGFLTEEIREGGGRVGFQGRTLDGTTFRLAHVDVGGPYRVGPYGVDVAALESIGVPSLEPREDTGLVVVDEVGKMESFSEAFRAAVERLLAGPTPLLATVAVHGVGFVKRVRHDSRVTLVKMSRASRDAVIGDLLRRLARIGIAPQRPSAGGPG